MKKWLSAVLAVLLVTLSVTPVLAHGSHHGKRRVVSYTACSIASCVLTGLHVHDGKTYIAHHVGDGHDYHAYCEVADCVLAEYHEHEGVYCFGHVVNDGHSYHHLGWGHH